MHYAARAWSMPSSPSEVFLGDVLRRVDGPVAPFEDADTLRRRMQTDAKHRSLFKILLEVRDATARILDSTSVADLCRK